MLEKLKFLMSRVFPLVGLLCMACLGGSSPGGLPLDDPLPGGQGPGISVAPVALVAPVVLLVSLGSPIACIASGALVFVSALGVLVGLISVQGPVPLPPLVGPALLSVPF